MQLHAFYAVVYALCSTWIPPIDAYPALAMPGLFDSMTGTKDKKSGDFSIPQQPDADVLELEHLRSNHGDESTVATLHQKYHSQLPVGTLTHGESLPELERQLEAATPAATTTTSAPPPLIPLEAETGQTEQEQIVPGPVHRPPMLPHGEGVQQTHPAEAGSTAERTAGVPSMAKPFYGAARLAFGQNPEVLPVSSTTSTTTTTTTTSTTATTTASHQAESSEEAGIATATEADAAAPALDLDTAAAPAEPTPEQTLSTVSIGGTHKSQSRQSAAASVKHDHNEHTRETIGDVIFDEEDDETPAETIKAAASRRSVTIIPPKKTADNLLRHRDGQYSSFDMAQYVFWTGDEAGVARAVEEFIEQGLMTRENALKFLRDIRLGIEYLQRSHDTRVIPEELHQNSVKKSYPPPKPTTSTTTSTTTTTEKPFPFVHLERPLPRLSGNHLTNTNAIDSIALWNKLQELNNDDGRQDLGGEYGEATGRAKIAEFLYTEYTLEEILYKLAKVMFTQSLAHGSDEAQQELQKLTDFLEREGNLGVIPIDLQKKVLHVLLTALSDTLSEHPELLPAARLNLANPYKRFPMHASY